MWIALELTRTDWSQSRRKESLLFVRNPASVIVLLAVVGACRSEPASRTAVVQVDGRKNQTPFLASRGDFVVVAWSADRDGDTDLFLATSTDGGHTFSEPRRVNDIPGDVNVYGEQPPRVALGAGAPLPVYVTWTSANQEKKLSFFRFARSLDGGETFEPSVTLHDADLPGDRGWHSLAVSPTGEVHAVWLDSRPEGGESMGLYHARWKGGTSPRAERLFDHVCECCKTTMAIGEDGAVHAAWRQIYEDNYRDIAFSSSRDGGDGCSDAVRVNEDGWQINGCPDDGPSLAVDSHGRVHIVWPTLVHEKMDTGLFSASTTDGRSFSPRLPVPTAEGTDPSHPQVSLDGRGNPVAVWDEVLDGRRRIVASRATITGEGELFWNEPILLDEGGEEASGSYPVPAASGAGALVAWTSQMGDESVIRIRRLE
jgi:hypothetical protein